MPRIASTMSAPHTPESFDRAIVRGSAVLTSLVCLFLFALSPVMAEEECSFESYGAGVEEGESVAVSALLASPEDFSGRTVRVAGTVKDVCRMAGCWMEIVAEGPEGSDPVKVKVEDGVIVFPISTLGHQAIAQGTVEVKELDREAYASYQKHLADEQDRDFDEASIGEGPFRSVQILGTGARVCVD